MNTAEDSLEKGPERRHAFATTRWSVIRRAADTDEDTSHEKALAELCGAYWFPLYAYVRRTGRSREDAEDATQSFFSQLLRKARLGDLAPEHGKFRSFLLTSLKNFLIDDWRKSKTETHGGTTEILRFNLDEFEERFARENLGEDNPEHLFDRGWAVALVDRVYGRLGHEYARAGKAELFERLRGCMLGDGDGTYAELAAASGMSEGGFTMAVHRLRRRFGDEIRDEVAQTVDTKEEVETELRWLFSVLADDFPA